MPGFLSRASFRRPPTSGQVTFTVLSLHINNIYAKKKGIAKKLLTIRAIMISTPRALHHCGDLDPFRTIGQTSTDFSNHQVLIDFGKCISMVHSPSHEELLACCQLIKVAIMRHGSTWISSIGTTLGNRKVTTVDTFPSKNVLRHIIRSSRKDASVKS